MVKCDECNKEVIGKGFHFHDDFGMEDYVFCDRNCYNEFKKSMVN